MNIAVMPVSGRHPLLKYTIPNTLKVFDEVICVGNDEDRSVCEDSGAMFWRYKNSPLGEKLNYGFRLAKLFDPDIVSYVGSAILVSRNWIKCLSPFLNSCDMVGIRDSYFVDISPSDYTVYKWCGYKNPRFNIKTLIATHSIRKFIFGDHRELEPIGTARLISKCALERLNWEPFNPEWNKSMDRSIYSKLKDTTFMYTGDDVVSAAVSCFRWENKHNNVLPLLDVVDDSVIMNEFDFLPAMISSIQNK